MKMKNELRLVFIPILISFSGYLVFYNEIASKPSDAGFWMILAMGISIGLALKVLFQKLRK